MEKRTYNQLLSEIILLPLIKKDFNRDDKIYNYAKAYKNILYTRKNEEYFRPQYRMELTKAKNELIDIFFNDTRWDHLDDTWLMLEKFYAGYNISDYIQENNDMLGINYFYIDHILKIARTFVTFRDGVASIRYWSGDNDVLLPGVKQEAKIELWNYISRTTVPDIFIASAYVNSEIKDIDCLFNVSNLVCLADMPLRKIFDKGVAETHLHLNAGNSYHFLWNRCTSLFYYDGKSNELCFCTCFKLYAALYLEARENKITFEGNFKEFYYNYIPKELRNVFLKTV